MTLDATLSTKEETPVSRRTAAAWPWLAVLGVIVLGAALRFWGALSIGSVADVAAYRQHIEIAVIRHESVYERSPPDYPYLPGWLAVEVETWHASRQLHIEFWQAIRLVIVAGDVGVCFAVWWLASRLGGATRGRWAAAIYALSPIALLISGNHGQFDSLPTLFSLLAAGVVLSKRPRRAYEAGALLAVAIMLKPFPVLLLPAFLLAGGLDWRGRVQLAATTGVLVLAGSAPALVDSPGGLFRSVVQYHGVIDVGPGGLLRALWLNHTGFYDLPGTFGSDLASVTRIAALMLMALVIIVLRGQPLPRIAATTYLAFLAIYGGLSAQYLLWPLAWLLVSDIDLRWSAAYAVAAAIGAVGMYMVFWPGILVPGLEGLKLGNAGYYALCEAVLVVTCWAVLLALIWPRLRSSLRGDKYVRVAAVVFVLSMLPVFHQVDWLVGRYRHFEGLRANEVGESRPAYQVQDATAFVEP